VNWQYQSLVDFAGQRGYKKADLFTMHVAGYWTFLYDMFILLMFVKGKLSLSKRKHGHSAPHRSSTNVMELSSMA
jgi:hypothetical protein